MNGFGSNLPEDKPERMELLGTLQRLELAVNLEVFCKETALGPRINEDSVKESSILIDVN